MNKKKLNVHKIHIICWMSDIQKLGYNTGSRLGKKSCNEVWQNVAKSDIK